MRGAGFIDHSGGSSGGGSLSGWSADATRDSPAHLRGQALAAAATGPAVDVDTAASYELDSQLAAMTALAASTAAPPWTLLQQQQPHQHQQQKQQQQRHPQSHHMSSLVQPNPLAPLHISQLSDSHPSASLMAASSSASSPSDFDPITHLSSSSASAVGVTSPFAPARSRLQRNHQPHSAQQGSILTDLSGELSVFDEGGDGSSSSALSSLHHHQHLSSSSLYDGHTGVAPVPGPHVVLSAAEAASQARTRFFQRELDRARLLERQRSGHAAHVRQTPLSKAELVDKRVRIREIEARILHLRALQAAKAARVKDSLAQVGQAHLKFKEHNAEVVREGLQVLRQMEALQLRAAAEDMQHQAEEDYLQRQRAAGLDAQSKHFFLDEQKVPPYPSAHLGPNPQTTLHSMHTPDFPLGKAVVQAIKDPYLVPSTSPASAAASLAALPDVPLPAPPALLDRLAQRAMASLESGVPLSSREHALLMSSVAAQNARQHRAHRVVEEVLSPRRGVPQGASPEQQAQWVDAHVFGVHDPLKAHAHTFPAPELPTPPPAVAAIAAAAASSPRSPARAQWSGAAGASDLGSPANVDPASPSKPSASFLALAAEKRRLSRFISSCASEWSSRSVGAQARKLAAMEVQTDRVAQRRSEARVRFEQERVLALALLQKQQVLLGAQRAERREALARAEYRARIARVSNLVETDALWQSEEGLAQAVEVIATLRAEAERPGPMSANTYWDTNEVPVFPTALALDRAAVAAQGLSRGQGQPAAAGNNFADPAFNVASYSSTLAQAMAAADAADPSALEVRLAQQAARYGPGGSMQRPLGWRDNLWEEKDWSHQSDSSMDTTSNERQQQQQQQQQQAAPKPVTAAQRRSSILLASVAPALGGAVAAPHAATVHHEQSPSSSESADDEDEEDRKYSSGAAPAQQQQTHQQQKQELLHQSVPSVVADADVAAAAAGDAGAPHQAAALAASMVAAETKPTPSRRASLLEAEVARQREADAQALQRRVERRRAQALEVEAAQALQAEQLSARRAEELQERLDRERAMEAERQQLRSQRAKQAAQIEKDIAEEEARLAQARQQRFEQQRQDELQEQQRQYQLQQQQRELQAQLEEQHQRRLALEAQRRAHDDERERRIEEARLAEEAYKRSGGTVAAPIRTHAPGDIAVWDGDDDSRSQQYQQRRYEQHQARQLALDQSSALSSSRSAQEQYSPSPRSPDSPGVAQQPLEVRDAEAEESPASTARVDVEQWAAEQQQLQQQRQQQQFVHVEVDSINRSAQASPRAGGGAEVAASAVVAEAHSARGSTGRSSQSSGGVLAYKIGASDSARHSERRVVFSPEVMLHDPSTSEDASSVSAAAAAGGGGGGADHGIELAELAAMSPQSLSVAGPAVPPLPQGGLPTVHMDDESGDDGEDDGEDEEEDDYEDESASPSSAAQRYIVSRPYPRSGSGIMSPSSSVSRMGPSVPALPTSGLPRLPGSSPLGPSDIANPELDVSTRARSVARVIRPFGSAKGRPELPVKRRGKGALALRSPASPPAVVPSTDPSAQPGQMALPAQAAQVASKEASAPLEASAVAPTTFASARVQASTTAAAAAAASSSPRLSPKTPASSSSRSSGKQSKSASSRSSEESTLSERERSIESMLAQPFESPATTARPSAGANAAAASERTNAGTAIEMAPTHLASPLRPHGAQRPPFPVARVPGPRVGGGATIGVGDAVHTSMSTIHGATDPTLSFLDRTGGGAGGVDEPFSFGEITDVSGFTTAAPTARSATSAPTTTRRSMPGLAVPASLLVEDSPSPPRSGVVTPGAALSSRRSGGSGGGALSGRSALSSPGSASRSSAARASAVLESMDSDEFSGVFEEVHDYGFDSRPISGATTARSTARAAGGAATARSANNAAATRGATMAPSLPPQPNPPTPRHASATATVLSPPQYATDVPLHFSPASATQAAGQTVAAAAAAAGPASSIPAGRPNRVSSVMDYEDSGDEGGDLENFVVTAGGLYDARSP